MLSVDSPARVSAPLHQGIKTTSAPAGNVEARESMCPLQNLAGVEVDDPVAPSPAAAIGDATISSVGPPPKLHRRPESRPTISLVHLNRAPLPRARGADDGGRWRRDAS